MQRTFLGLDIGYSGVKLAYGQGRQPQLLTLAPGAAPVSDCALGFNNQPNLGAGFEVLIEGRPWVGGIDPASLERFARVMDSSYPSTPQYLALFYAALLATNADVVDALTIGLPVRQFRNPAERAALEKRLKGTHVVTPSRSVEVRNVLVVPQPTGAYADITLGVESVRLASLDPPAVPTKDETVLCIDPGHFSLDWVCFRGGLKLDSSDSSTQAGEAILKRTADLISMQEARVVPLDKLEAAVRNRRSTVQIGQLSLDIEQALSQAAREIIAQNLNLIRGSIRAVSHSMSVDVVLLCGGGADMVEAAVAHAFPDSRLIKPVDPVMANARGFWALAQQVARSGAKAA